MGEERKDPFRSILETFFKNSAFNNFRDIFNEEDLEKVDKEEFEITRGKYKSKITVFLSKEGYPVTLSSRSEVIQTEEENRIEFLQNKLTEAVELEDYAQAAEIQKELKQLREPTN